jgi:uroporphyrinogen decarboxylase
MEARHLKDRYGDRLCFWGGGCDTREVLPNGTPTDVDHHVREQVEVMSPGGGFVFQQVHNIMANVPPENTLTMFRAVRS